MLLLNCQADLETACFPRTPAASILQHILQQDPNSFQALCSGKGELEPKPDLPPLLSSPPLAEAAQQRAKLMMI